MPKLSPKPKTLSKKKQALTASPGQQSSAKPQLADAGTLPGAPRLFVAALKVLGDNWKLFLGIIAIYGVLLLLLTQGWRTNTSVLDVKTILEQTGTVGHVLTGTTLFTYLLGNAGSAPTDAAGIYQFMLILITSLAIIWVLRQAYANKQVRLRDGFYYGMYPLIPFMLVLGVIALQLLPFIIGAFIFVTVQMNMLAVGLEVGLWGLLFFGLALCSLYMLASSLFALYIVCLPDMQPMAALRSARQLVRGRRWTVLRKMLFLPFALLVLTAIIMIPLTLIATPVAVWVFFVISVLSLPIAHSYMYRLYRELL